MRGAPRVGRLSRLSSTPGGLHPFRGCADGDLAAFDPGHDSPLSRGHGTRVETETRAREGVDPFPCAVCFRADRYGSETVVLSPVAEMLKVPATVLLAYA